MLRFLGYDLELAIEEVLAGTDCPSLFTAHDATGGSWVVAQADYDPNRLAWLCAPVSERASAAVVERRAEPRDVIKHSLTGVVELIALDHGRATPDRCLLCQDLTDDLLHEIAAEEPLLLAS